MQIHHHAGRLCDLLSPRALVTSGQHVKEQIPWYAWAEDKPSFSPEFVLDRIRGTALYRVTDKTDIGILLELLNHIVIRKVAVEPYSIKLSMD